MNKIDIKPIQSFLKLKPLESKLSRDILLKNLKKIVALLMSYDANEHLNFF